MSQGKSNDSKNNNNSSNVQDHQYAIGKGSITKQFTKNVLEWNLIIKEILGNKSYTSRTTYQKTNTHSNDRLQQRHPKVPEDPN